MTDQTAVSDDREQEDERSFDDYFDELNGIKSDTDEESSSNDDGNDDDESGEPVDNTHDELEELRQLNARLQQERDHFEHSFKSQVGRVSALQKKIDSEVQEPPAEKEIDPSLQEVINDYPEIAKPIIDYLEKKYADIGSKIAPIEQSEQQRQAQAEQQYIEHQINILDSAHTGWRDKIASADYKAWLDKQPAPVRQMADSYHAEDYQYLLNSFDATQNKSADLTARRQAKLAANVQVPSSGVSKKSTAPDDFNAAWDYFASKK